MMFVATFILCTSFSACIKMSTGCGVKVVCDLCGKSVRSSGLKAHKALHVLDKTLECGFEGCEKLFGSKETLKR